MTQMTPDLYKAILAMDSYNRGYGASIDLKEKDKNDNYMSIGNAKIYDTRGDVSAKSIGFYGIAYSLSGQTIISYRGTDSLLGSPESGGSDTLHGYGIGAGFPTPSSQGDMAINFYKDVAQSIYGSP